MTSTRTSCPVLLLSYLWRCQNREVGGAVRGWREDWGKGKASLCNARVVVICSNTRATTHWSLSSFSSLESKGNIAVFHDCFTSLNQLNKMHIFRLDSRLLLTPSLSWRSAILLSSEHKQTMDNRNYTHRGKGQPWTCTGADLGPTPGQRGPVQSRARPAGQHAVHGSGWARYGAGTEYGHNYHI